MCIYIYIHIHIYMCIYIYIERERVIELNKGGAAVFLSKIPDLLIESLDES